MLYDGPPCISAPHLADSASIIITGQKLGLITEKVLYEMYEFRIRGGQSMIPHRYALANNNCYFYNEKYAKTDKLSKEETERKGTAPPAELDPAPCPSALTITAAAIHGGPNRTIPGELLRAPALAAAVLSQKTKNSRGEAR
jgi:hypothetical protein